MRWLALASDYDGTLAHEGAVARPTLAALKSFRDSGRKLILVTGRELADLKSVFSQLDLFDRIVAENGAVLYTPATRKSRILAEPPEPAFVDALRRRRVRPISLGSVIVATRQPNEVKVLEVIRDLGLELQVTFNKGAVMILPSGVNKESGLKAALAEIDLEAKDVVGVGDAENDHAFLRFCGLSAAVANALPSVKETADLTTRSEEGAGVVELIEQILNGNLAAHKPA